MLTKSAIEQCEYNSEPHACNIRNPILHIRAASKRRLDELYETAKGTCAHKDRDEPDAARTRQRKSECCKGNEVYNFIASIWTRRLLMDRLKHGHCQNSSYNQCERDIEILAHVNRV